jgi:cephalosporin-C deacetylase
MGSFGDALIYGWLAVPNDTTALLPGYLWLPGYSLGNPPPGPESLYENVVTLGLNIHGNLPDTPYVHPFTQSKDYVTQGIESPDTYIFRAIVAHCARAFEVLMQQPEVDPERCLVGGMSQGGGLALIVAALLGRKVRLCFADMPWLCNLDLALSLIDRERYRRSPNMRVPDGRYYIEQYAERHPELRDRIFQTYRYFDPLSHAQDIVTPVQMSAGGRDPSCRPPTIYSVYNAIGAPKEMLYLPTTGHEIVRPMWEAHSNWLQSKLQ